MSSIPTMLHHSNNWNAHKVGTYHYQLHKNNARNRFMTFKRLLSNQHCSLDSFLSNEFQGLISCLLSSWDMKLMTQPHLVTTLQLYRAIISFPTRSLTCWLPFTELLRITSHRIITQLVRFHWKCDAQIMKNTGGANNEIKGRKSTLLITSSFICFL
jgi:hypothetical protein